MSKFFYSPMFPLTEDTTEYIKISKSYVKTKKINNSELLIVNPKALTFLSQRAFFDVSHLLRKSHLQQLKNILDDREASQNDRFVALSMLKNANIASGSFGPTTAGRMDAYVDKFQQNGGSMVMLAKGNRSKEVKESCKKYGGFYLGTIGGAAEKVAQDYIKKIEIVEYPEFGMEAVWKIEVEKFPAFVVIDNKGNDFFEI